MRLAQNRNRADLIDIWMNDCHMVITSDTVAKCRQLLIHSLDFDLLFECISNVLQLLICGCAWHKQAILVASCQAPKNTASSNCGPNHGNMIS